MNLQLKQLGSQRKTSVSGPKIREQKPYLAFKTPTYSFRDSRFLSTRQGGLYYPAAAGLFLVLLALTVKIHRVKIIINMMGKLYSPVNPVRKPDRSFLSDSGLNILSYHIFLKILLLMEDLNGVYPIASKNHHKYIFSPE